MDEIKVIVNPNSGRGRGREMTPAIHAALRRADIPYSLEMTNGHGNGIDLARKAREEGYEIVVAAGGDGTVSEVVNGLALAAGENAPVVGTLGILPVGSANDFAAMAGVPMNLQEAAQNLLRGQTRLVDLGRVNNHYFDNNMGVGFEAAVTLESMCIQRLRGVLLYLVAVLRAIRKNFSPHVHIEWDDGSVDKRILMVSIGNSRRTGGGFYVTPDAEIDDGQLDYAIADALSSFGILKILPKVMLGKHKNHSAVSLGRMRWMHIVSDEPLPVHADGEMIYTDAHELHIEVQPQRLEVIV